MKTIARIILVLVALFITLGMFGAFDNSGSSVARQKREICLQSLADAAPGAEKRTAREMCNAMGVKP